MKEYQGEKAIISLTSWKARINTASKTIYSLIKSCPGFHIVLTLSEDEFPQKEKELPENLLSLSDYFEILWVKKNYKSFKKFAFTLKKYKGVPVISADDDCLYVLNYAQNLYDEWLKTKENVIRYTFTTRFITQGPCTLYWNINFPVEQISDSIIQTSKDDNFYAEHLKQKGVNIHCCKYTKLPIIFHDDIQPISKNQRSLPFYKNNFID